MGFQHYFTCIYAKKKHLAPAHVFMRVGWGHQWGHVDTCVAALMFICFQWTSSSLRTALNHIHPWNTFTKALILLYSLLLVCSYFFIEQFSNPQGIRIMGAQSQPNKPKRVLDCKQKQSKLKKYLCFFI
jgi:hypothetical protein